MIPAFGEAPPGRTLNNQILRPAGANARAGRKVAPPSYAALDDYVALGENVVGPIVNREAVILAYVNQPIESRIAHTRRNGVVSVAKTPNPVVVSFSATSPELQRGPLSVADRHIWRPHYTAAANVYGDHDLVEFAVAGADTSADGMTRAMSSVQVSGLYHGRADVADPRNIECAEYFPHFNGLDPAEKARMRQAFDRPSNEAYMPHELCMLKWGHYGQYVFSYGRHIARRTQDIIHPRPLSYLFNGKRHCFLYPVFVACAQRYCKKFAEMFHLDKPQLTEFITAPASDDHLRVTVGSTRVENVTITLGRDAYIVDKASAMKSIVGQVLAASATSKNGFPWDFSEQLTALLHGEQKGRAPCDKYLKRLHGGKRISDDVYAAEVVPRTKACTKASSVERIRLLRRLMLEDEVDLPTSSGKRKKISCKEGVKIEDIPIVCAALDIVPRFVNVLNRPLMLDGVDQDERGALIPAKPPDKNKVMRFELCVTRDNHCEQRTGKTEYVTQDELNARLRFPRGDDGEVDESVAGLRFTVHQNNVTALIAPDGTCSRPVRDDKSSYMSDFKAANGFEWCEMDMVSRNHASAANAVATGARQTNGAMAHWVYELRKENGPRLDNLSVFSIDSVKAYLNAEKVCDEFKIEYCYPMRIQAAANLVFEDDAQMLEMLRRRPGYYMIRDLDTRTLDRKDRRLFQILGYVHHPSWGQTSPGGVQRIREQRQRRAALFVEGVEFTPAEKVKATPADYQQERAESMENSVWPSVELLYLYEKVGVRFKVRYGAWSYGVLKSVDFHPEPCERRQKDEKNPRSIPPTDKHDGTPMYSLAVGLMAASRTTSDEFVVTTEGVVHNTLMTNAEDSADFSDIDPGQEAVASELEFTDLPKSNFAIDGGMLETGDEVENVSDALRKKELISSELGVVRIRKKLKKTKSLRHIAGFRWAIQRIGLIEFLRRLPSDAVDCLGEVRVDGVYFKYPEGENDVPTVLSKWGIRGLVAAVEEEVGDKLFRVEPDKVKLPNKAPSQCIVPSRAGEFSAGGYTDAHQARITLRGDELRVLMRDEIYVLGAGGIGKTHTWCQLLLQLFDGPLAGVQNSWLTATDKQLDEAINPDGRILWGVHHKTTDRGACVSYISELENPQRRPPKNKVFTFDTQAVAIDESSMLSHRLLTEAIEAHRKRGILTVCFTDQHPITFAPSQLSCIGRGAYASPGVDAALYVQERNIKRCRQDHDDPHQQKVLLDMIAQIHDRMHYEYPSNGDNGWAFNLICETLESAGFGDHILDTEDAVVDLYRSEDTSLLVSLTNCRKCNPLKSLSLDDPLEDGVKDLRVNLLENVRAVKSADTEKELKKAVRALTGIIKQERWGGNDVLEIIDDLKETARSEFAALNIERVFEPVERVVSDSAVTKAHECSCGVESRSQVARWTQRLIEEGNAPKWQCLRNVKEHNAFRGQVRVSQERPPPPKAWAELHAMSMHAYQGRTCDAKCIFDASHVWAGLPMFNVFVTRVRRLSQLYIYHPYARNNPKFPALKAGHFNVPGAWHEEKCKRIFNLFIAAQRRRDPSALQDARKWLIENEIAAADADKLLQPDHLVCCRRPCGGGELDLAICHEGRPVLGIEVVDTHPPDLERLAQQKAELIYGVITVYC